MSTSASQVQLLATIYPEHIWIDVDLHELDQWQYLQIVSQHLTESLNLAIAPAFPSQPSQLRFVSKLVDGFALSVGGMRIVFVPSVDLDLLGFEIPREWVELSNWAADYYVPIQVDVEHNCLHLWGFISHQYLCQRANLDLTAQSYEVDGMDLIGDLDSLWTSCDLVAQQLMPIERGTSPNLPPLETLAAQKLIDRLKQHRSIFSPRLELPFAEWGAILNSPKYLQAYAEPKSVITHITSWFGSQVQSIEQATDKLVTAIGEKIHHQEWISIDEFNGLLVALPGFMNESVQQKFNLQGSIPTNEREICQIVRNLYANQNPTKQVNLPQEIGSSLALLLHLIQHTTDETLRWQAAEYLWSIDPTNTHTYQRKIKDLGLVMRGYKLGLMVAAIPLLDGTYSILNRIYAIGNEKCLPSDVRLTLATASGEQLYQVESSSTVTDRYIQLYFTASIDDQFNIWVEMDNARIVEAFAL